MTVRVVTLPRGADALAFATRARAMGADALEVRDDLTERFDAAALAKVLPLLLAHRGGSGFTAEARRLARWEDSDLGPIVSRHFETPLAPGDAEAFWASRSAQLIKHVEPEPGPRLLETQRRLIARFGAGRVTVLGVGPYALPWRAVLARRNAFDYLALDAESASALGQRLLADAVRADPADGPRLAIIGHRISGSRSPRVHEQPFDRWDLPPDAPVAELVEQLREHYRGFAITSPFKRSFRVAAVEELPLSPTRGEGAPFAVNTLVRRGDGWLGANTDVDGARAVIERYHLGAFTALGDGGATWALKQAARGPVTVVRAREARPVTGDVFWTWPEHLPTPPGLRLDGARVLVIVYGAAAKRLAARIVQLGGTPVRAGAAWFVAQARAQRRLWNGTSLRLGGQRSEAGASSSRSDPSPWPSPRLGRGNSL